MSNDHNIWYKCLQQEYLKTWKFDENLLIPGHNCLIKYQMIIISRIKIKKFQAPDKMSAMTKTVRQLIITVGQNVRHNKHSIGQKTITFVGFLNVKKST